MTASSGRGLWAHLVTLAFLGTALSAAACNHRETMAGRGPESPAPRSTASVHVSPGAAQAVSSEGTGRWQGCEILGPGNDSSPPAMIITCDDGRRFSRVEVKPGQFTEAVYRDNVDRFIENALGFQVRSESATLALPQGQEARVERLVARVERSEGGAADTAIALAGVFLPGATGSFITCSRPLDGLRDESDFDDCDADIRALFENPPWPASIPGRGSKG